VVGSVVTNVREGAPGIGRICSAGNGGWGARNGEWKSPITSGKKHGQSLWHTKAQPKYRRGHHERPSFTLPPGGSKVRHEASGRAAAVWIFQPALPGNSRWLVSDHSKEVVQLSSRLLDAICNVVEFARIPSQQSSYLSPNSTQLRKELWRVPLHTRAQRDHLRRLEAAEFQGHAVVHWTMTIRDRRTRWLALPNSVRRVYCGSSRT